MLTPSSGTRSAVLTEPRITVMRGGSMIAVTLACGPGVPPQPW
jgi:hypothetical protein